MKSPAAPYPPRSGLLIDSTDSVVNEEKIEVPEITFLIEKTPEISTNQEIHEKVNGDH